MVEYLRTKLIKALIDHFGTDDRRIEHALRVTAWAEKILEHEGGDREVILAVGLLHDVGIREAEALHGIASGNLQEKYGPPIVRRILEQLGFSEARIIESCGIVGNHHTPAGITGPNFPVLWDADMLVNVRDELSEADESQLSTIIEKSFKTATGKQLARQEFLS